MMLGCHASYSKASCDFFFLNPTDPIYQETHSMLNEKKRADGPRSLLSSAESKLYICAYILDEKKKPLQPRRKKKKPLAHRVTNYTLNKSVNIYSLYITKQNKNNKDTSTLFYIWTRTSGLHSNVSIFHNVNSSNAMTTTSARNNKVYVTTKKQRDEG